MPGLRAITTFGVGSGSRAGLAVRVSWRVLALVAALATAVGAAVTYLPASAAAGTAVVLGACLLSWLAVRATADSLAALLLSLPLLSLPLLPFLAELDANAAY